MAEQISLFEQEIQSRGLSELFTDKHEDLSGMLYGYGLSRTAPDSLKRTNPSIHLKYVNGSPPLSSLQIIDAMCLVATKQLQFMYSPEKVQELVLHAADFSLRSKAVSEVFQTVSFSCPLLFLKNLSGNSSNSVRFKESVCRIPDIEIQINAMGDAYMGTDKALREFRSRPISNLAFLDEGVVRWSYDSILFFIQFSERFSYTRLPLKALVSINSTSAYLLYRNCLRYKNLKTKVAFTKRLTLEDWACMLVGAEGYREATGELNTHRFKSKVVQEACKYLCNSTEVDIAVAPVFDRLGGLRFGVVKKPFSGPHRFKQVDYKDFKAYIERASEMGVQGQPPYFVESSSDLWAEELAAGVSTPSGLTILPMEDDLVEYKMQQAGILPPFKTESCSDKEVVLEFSAGRLVASPKEEQLERQPSQDDSENTLRTELLEFGLYPAVVARLLKQYTAEQVSKAFQQAKQQALAGDVRSQSGFVASQIEKLLEGQVEWIVPQRLKPTQTPAQIANASAAAVSPRLSQFEALTQLIKSNLTLKDSQVLFAALVHCPSFKYPGDKFLLGTKEQGGGICAKDASLLALAIKDEKQKEFLLNHSACASILKQFLNTVEPLLSVI